MDAHTTSPACGVAKGPSLSALIVAALVATSVPAAFGQAPAAEDASSPPPRVLRDREGGALRLRTEDIIDVLQNGRVVSRKPIGVGVTGAERLVLEHHGVQIRAAFHDVDETQLGPKRQGPTKKVLYFLDSYRAQAAAYELSLLLGVDAVPPTVVRRIGKRNGSLQLWVEGCKTWGMELESGDRPPDSTFRQRQMDDVRVFDNLIGNIDRNHGNILIDGEWNLWWIDHTRAFAKNQKLFDPENVRRASHPLWDAIRSMDKKEVTEILKPYLGSGEIDALFVRRDKLVGLIDGKIAARGAGSVLFNYTDPPTAIRITMD